MFLDVAKIFVKGGDGGRGCISFLREKYRPRGGPDGGDGGAGGSVILKPNSNIRSLTGFRRRVHYKAERGQHGQGKNKHGRQGTDLIIDVPCGTLVKAKDGKVIDDLTKSGEEAIVAKGGMRGRGNARFVSSSRKLPSFAEKGEPGEEKWIVLELKLLADVGIIGLPNAGKSTLISRISNARPKIADYPFTTRVPNLGVVELEEGRSFVVADIPGLIEGAHQGRGLGDAFLKHIERTAILVHVIDLSGFGGTSPIDNYQLVNKEIKLYSPDLAKRPQIVVGNKIDLGEARDNLPKVRDYINQKGETFLAISAATGEGVNELLSSLVKMVKEKVIPKISEPEVQKILRHKDYQVGDKIKDFKVEPAGEGLYIVKGKTLMRMVIMTDLNNKEALAYLQQKFKKIGVEDELKKAGAKPGDTVKIGEIEFDFDPSEKT